VGICIAPTQVALGAERRVCYPGNTVNSQLPWAVTYHLSQSTSNQERKVDIAAAWARSCDLRHRSDQARPHKSKQEFFFFLIYMDEKYNDVHSIIEFCAILRLA
jgi:hypothetical protein